MSKSGGENAINATINTIMNFTHSYKHLANISNLINLHNLCNINIKNVCILGIDEGQKCNPIKSKRML